MDIQATKIELIQLLLNENKADILLAVKNVLQKPSVKSEDETITALLKKSEKEYSKGEKELLSNVLNEAKSKYF